MKNIFVGLMIFLTAQASAVVYQQPTPQFKPHIEISAVYIEYRD
jgi:hypothetical protein